MPFERGIATPDDHYPQTNVTSPKDSTIVQAVHKSQQHNYVIVDAFESTASKYLRAPIIFDETSIPLTDTIDDISTPTSAKKPSIRTICIPKEVTQIIELPLGILQKDLLVFLDKDYWIRTWRLNSSTTGINLMRNLRRHFFLPRDWISSESLLFAHLATDGTLFCPQNGKMVVISTALASGW
ncbi:hypothetical protein EJ05DRAFT_503218 [Pseudovirgaria hyperparasitica]|uniref:Uncharacterized protein n=1 Tax=Pseudovirgaria hyperparasitica TaxID=470096 RepID=A0A6A6VZT5_9PEZI|nr:uncharacterized protein EJ05DRAFT_503218 [Pseudovirgaria hyperparasitica]KAF2755765.1 hypothetical protein EJ05DRAFT_503218 [Pseudovirgaria hyperparasitica]